MKIADLIPGRKLSSKELREQLAAVERKAASAAEAVGEAIANGLPHGDASRDEDALRRRAEQLRFALVAAGKREVAEQAEEKSAEEKRAAEEVAALRLRRIALAGKVDEALKAFGNALRDYASCPGPARAIRSYISGAIALTAPELLNILAIRGVERTFRVPLAEYEEKRGDTLNPNLVGVTPMRIEPAEEVQS